MDSLSHLRIRAANKCRTNEGQGVCIEKSECQGISTPDVCPNDPEGVQCCLVHECSVPEGDGVCVSEERDGCPEGELVPGTKSPWPCIGPDDIQCCVKSTDMATATSSSVPTTSSGPITTSDSSTESSSASESTPTNTSPPDVAITASPTPMETDSASETGLSGGQIGGISAGAAVAGILIIASLVLMYMRQRRRIKQLEGGHGGKRPPVAEVPADGEKKADAELVGSPISPSVQEPPRDVKHTYMAPGTEASPTELDPQSPYKFTQNVQVPVELPAAEPAERRKF